MSDEKPKAPNAADIMAAVTGIAKAFEALTASIPTLTQIDGVVKARVEEAELRIVAAVGKGSGASAPADLGPPPPQSTWPTTLPNYGRAKGSAIFGATANDLDYYANGARRSIADPAKARWRDKERALLAAIEAEQQRQAGAVNPAQTAIPPGGGGGWDTAPPPVAPPDFGTETPMDDLPFVRCDGVR